MKKKSIVLILSIFMLSCSTTRKITCPNSNIVFIHKKPEKVYKEYVNNYNGQIKLTLDVLEKIKLTDIDINTKNEIISLREKLDQNSIRFQDLLKSNYLAYSMNPCDESTKNNYFSVLNNMILEQNKLKSIDDEAKKLIKNTNFGISETKKLTSLINEIYN